MVDQPSGSPFSSDRFAERSAGRMGGLTGMAPSSNRRTSEGRESGGKLKIRKANAGALVSAVSDVPGVAPAVLTAQQADARANAQAARVAGQGGRRRAGTLRSSTVLASGLGGAATTKTLLGT